MRRHAALALAWAATATACSTVVVVDDTARGAGGSAAMASGTTAAAENAGSSTVATSATGGPKALCGDGILDPGEECDDGTENSCISGTTGTCTCTCHYATCGDGVRQQWEKCDQGAQNGAAGCTKACATTCGYTECSKAKVFKKVVSNMASPTTVGDGLPSAWSYQGYVGLAAGKALCQDVGADHVCSYDETVEADLRGELPDLAVPSNLTYWLRRTSDVADAAKFNVVCAKKADCGIAQVCVPGLDGAIRACASLPGEGGSCVDWAGNADDVSDGEWFERAKPPSAFAAGGVTKGSFSFHFDADTTLDGTPDHTCHDATKVGCAGPCAGVKRAILCCFPKCCP